MSAKLLSAFEFGTESVKVALAEMTGDEIILLGHAELPSEKTIQKGEIVDYDGFLNLMVDATTLVEESSGFELSDSLKLAISCSNPSLKSFNNTAMVHIEDEQGKVCDDDVKEVVRSARDPKLSEESAVIVTFQKSFTLDSTRKTSKPTGLIAHTLESEIHIVTMNRNSFDSTLSPLMDYFGKEQSITYSSDGIASGFACLTREEQESPTLVIDLGAGTSGFSFFQDCGCQASGLIPVGCHNLINDLAIGLDLEYGRCKRILHEEARAISQQDGRNRMLKVDLLAGNAHREIPRSSIELICELRLREIFTEIQKKLQVQGVSQLNGAKVYLCGRGALLPEITDLATEIFQAPAQIAQVNSSLIKGDTNFMKDPGNTVLAGLLWIAKSEYYNTEFKKNALQLGFKESMKNAKNFLSNAFRL